MVTDVRMKVQQRLTTFISRLNSAISRDPESMAEVAKAREHFPTAEKLRGRMRALTVAEFPGCELIFTRQDISVRLPDKYPNAKIPITAPIPPLLVECFHPRGMSNRPF